MSTATGWWTGSRVRLAVLAPALALAMPVAAVAQGGRAAAQEPGFARVTDAMLADPDPADWLSWRRTLDGWGYSPLDQIDRDNVHQLGLVWSWTMTAGLSQTTPIVHDGVMYLPGPLNVVQALDAVTGDLLWEYRKQFERSPDDSFRARTRSIAIYDDKIYLNTNDAHIVALDARTGDVVWDHVVADNRLGYRYTSGPIVVNGKIVAGMTGCERYKDGTCFISAHDPQTGAELWRTSTIAQPGEPGGDTWGDLPATFRAGGDAWIPGSYDPATNLTYWSTSQAKPWARLSRGTDGDALYTNSVLALDPDTGKLDWYYQFVPGETHDLDDVFESVLIDHRGRQSLFKMGKLGNPLGARSADRGFRGRPRPRLPDAGRRRPGNRRGHLPAGDDPGAGRRARVLPRLPGHPQLARGGLSPRDRDALHPDPPDLRQGDVPRGRARAAPDGGLLLLRQPALDRLAVGGAAPASEEPRPRRPPRGDGHRDRGGALAPLDPAALARRRVDHGGRPGGDRRR